MAFRLQHLRTPWAKKVIEIAEQWAESGAFSPAALLAEATVPITVKRSAQKYFMYAEMKSPIMLPDLEPQPELVQLTGAEYAARIEAQGPGDYYYFTQPVAKLAPTCLATHARDWTALIPDTPATRSPRGIRPYLSAWVGGSGSSTQAHYDVANNVFVQVHGHKRFRIYPPAATRAMHVFPDAHPRARKSQIDFDRPDPSVFPLAAGLPTPTVIDLGPGDALGIPAFWYHSVEALTPSVSLNTFYESPVRMAADRVFQLAAPFDYGWGARQMQQAMVVATEAAGAAAGRADAGAFVSDLLSSRYDVLYHRHPGKMSAPRPTTDPGDGGGDKAVDEQAIRDYCAEEYSPAFRALGAAVHDEYGAWPGLGPTAAHMQAISDIVLAHLVELWAVNLWRGLGVYPNLVACFRADGQ